MSTRNLTSFEAIAKIQKLAESIDFAMLSTGLQKRPHHVVPMSTKHVDDRGCIWFLSGRDSLHNRLIERDESVQIAYADPRGMEFLSVYGLATIVDDRAILERLYEGSDDQWFDGVEDPDLTAIRVDPKESHYWEPKGNKITVLFKMTAGAVSGNEPDIVVEGDLDW